MQEILSPAGIGRTVISFFPFGKSHAATAAAATAVSALKTLFPIISPHPLLLSFL